LSISWPASAPLPLSDKERKEGVVGNPCLAKGMRRVVEVVDEQTGVAKNVTMDGDDIGSFEACHRIVQLVLAKDAYVYSNKSFLKQNPKLFSIAYANSNHALSTAYTNPLSSTLSQPAVFSSSLISTTA
jgi:guanosine-diphosphatase